MESKNRFLKLYLLVISIVATLGMVIAFWWLAYDVLNNSIISDSEYLNGRNHREITNCNNPDYKYDAEEGREITTFRTSTEIAACEEQAKLDIVQQRKYSFKQSLIAELSWFSVFLVLFITHFPFFIRHNREKK